MRPRALEKGPQERTLRSRRRPFDIFWVWAVGVLGVATLNSCAAVYPGSASDLVTSERARTALDSRAPAQDRYLAGLAEGSSTAPKPQPASARSDEVQERTPAGKRLLIYRGRFGLLVPAVSEAVDRWVARAEAAGGYLQSRDQGKVVCRVPAAQFRALVAELSSFGRILSQSVEAQDVTREHFDLQLRLATAVSSLARLQELLKKAEDVKDLLQIEKEMRRLTEEIERFKGQLRFMEDQIAFSTLTVHFQSNAPAVRTARRQASRFAWIRALGVERMRGER